MSPTVQFALPSLKYLKSSLAPHISEKTVEFHYLKHHQGYLDNLNKILIEKQLSFTSLEEVVRFAYQKSELLPMYNNAGQVWNHNFYWESMLSTVEYKSLDSIQPLAAQIIKDFGSFATFFELFVSTGLSQFGSGWVWLVWSTKAQKLAITKTPNADSPLTTEDIPLLTSDVWEHAYYLDFQNLRKSYLEAFVAKLANWEFANSNLLAANKI